jgi:membrane fusion protein, multidrug efflux system
MSNPSIPSDTPLIKPKRSRKAAPKRSKKASPVIPPVTPPAAEPKHSGKAYWISSSIFLFCGIVYAVYWLIWGQFSESTNDAYVNGNMIMVTPQEKGIITTILVDNTQLVEAGQPLVQLDTHDYEIAFEKAKAELADSVRSVAQMFIKVEELQAKKEASEAQLLRAQLDYEHRQALVGDQSVSIEDFQHSETTYAAAAATVQEVAKELEGAIAEVDNTIVPTHPKVQRAKAALRDTYLALHRCKVLAPARGIITQRRAQVGQWVNAADPLMSLVPLDQIWVDANFREVSLKNFRIGQPVELVADMYGHDIKYHGEVVGLNPGTGSVFSVLPPQNATGNWIKIVQRIPVKISLDLDELKAHPLVLGLSMTAKVDTHDRQGLRLPRGTPSQPVYISDVYADELVGVEGIIDQIITTNIPDDAAAN